MAKAWRSYFAKPTPRNGVALLAGLLWTAAFPLINFPIAAWIAPGLLLLTGLGISPGHAARLGYIAGVVHFFTSLYWLLHIPFPIGNIAAWLSLSAYCALFPALWMWICWKTFPRTRNEESSTLRSAVESFFEQPWFKRQLWMLFCAVAWTALEFTRGWFLTGFPWNFLGTSQFKLIPLIQVAEFTGVQGVTFVVAWCSVTICVGALTLWVKPQVRFAWKNEIAVASLITISIVSWGASTSLKLQPAPERVLKLAMVQPSIPQTLIFDESESTNRFRQIMELSRAALETEPDVLVWPEASLPASLSQEYFNEIMEMVRSSATPIIFGALDFDVFNNGDEQRYQAYNAAFLFDGHGGHVATYRKQRLVIFGEYTPFAKQLPFLANLFPSGVGFGSGETPEPFIVGELEANVSVNICFEDNFSDVVSDQINSDTDFVLNLTNNGWFSESAAQWQHAANAVFRAVEDRTPLVRVTNNGLSCWIDEFGRIRELFRDDNGSVYGSGFQTIEVPLLDEMKSRQSTLYHRSGDWFGWGTFWMTLVVSGFQIVSRRKQQSPDVATHNPIL